LVAEEGHRLVAAGSQSLAEIAAHNAGPTAVERAGGAPTIATLRYVKNIEARESSLAGC
jgi:hypothetical protein